MTQAQNDQVTAEIIKAVEQRPTRKWALWDKCRLVRFSYSPQDGSRWEWEWVG